MNDQTLPMNGKRFVRAMKGSSGCIMWAFYFAWAAMDIHDVIGWTGLKRDTCYQALSNLEGDFLEAQVLAHGRKVWLLKSEMLPILRDLAVRAGDIQVIDADSDKPAGLLQESVFRTPGALNVVVDDLSLNVPTITTTTTTRSQESVFRTPAKSAALEKAFRKHRIIGKMKRELLAREWVDAAYVNASVQEAIGENKWDHPVGVAIGRMLEHVEVSTSAEGSLDSKIRSLRARGMPEDTDSQDARQKYVSGKYSNYIEH